MSIFNLEKAKEEHKKCKYILAHTTKLEAAHLQNLEVWQKLEDLYRDEEENWRLAAPIINSVLTQKRAYFCISRESYRKLLKSDKNLQPNSKKFRNDKWPLILSTLYKLGFKKIRSGTKGKAAIFEVTDLNLLNILNQEINKEEQLQECLDFHEGKKNEILEEVSDSEKENKHTTHNGCDLLSVLSLDNNSDISEDDISEDIENYEQVKEKDIEIINKHLEKQKCKPKTRMNDPTYNAFMQIQQKKSENWDFDEFNKLMANQPKEQ